MYCCHLEAFQLSDAVIMSVIIHVRVFMHRLCCLHEHIQISEHKYNVRNILHCFSVTEMFSACHHSISVINCPCVVLRIFRGFTETFIVCSSLYVYVFEKMCSSTFYIQLVVICKWLFVLF